MLAKVIFRLSRTEGGFAGAGLYPIGAGSSLAMGIFWKKNGRGLFSPMLLRAVFVSVKTCKNS